MLELHDVDAYYGQSHVLRDLSIDIGDDEIVALLGRNGAGKSTTIRSVMRSGPRVTGEIRVDGTSVVDATPEQVFDLGVSWVPEERRVFPNLTVEENLRMGVRDSGAVPEAYEEVFDLFPRLQERLNQRAGTMSGGESQMLAIGRALVSSPRLLLVDEPFEGLMPKLVDEVVETIQTLADRELSMLIAEQRTDLTLEMADRAYVIEKGELQYAGDASTLAEDQELQETYLGVR